MRRTPVLALIVALILSSGCFSFQKRASFSDTQRLEVTFENAAAAKAFSAAFDHPAVRHSDWKISVCALLLMNVELVLHEKEWHNYLVRKADINRDSVITEEEAQLLSPPAAQLRPSEGQ